MLDEKLFMERGICLEITLPSPEITAARVYRLKSGSRCRWRRSTQTESLLNYFPVTPNLVEQHNWSQTNSLSLLIYIETQLAYFMTVFISPSSSSSCTQSYMHSLTSPCLRLPYIQQQQLNYKILQIEWCNNSSTFGWKSDASIDRESWLN